MHMFIVSLVRVGYKSRSATKRLQTAMGDDTLCGSHLPLRRCPVESIFEVVGARRRVDGVVEVVPAVDDAVAEEVVPLVTVFHQLASHLRSSVASWD